MTEQATNTIEFADFLKVDIRVGVITSAERVPKSDKLLKLSVDFGAEIGVRQVIAGIGKSYTPESIVQAYAPFVINLAPRKMMGLDSEAMILAVSNIPTQPGITVLSVGPAAEIGSRVG